MDGVQFAVFYPREIIELTESNCKRKIKQIGTVDGRIVKMKRL
jgi:hypothetical protein